MASLYPENPSRQDGFSGNSAITAHVAGSQRQYTNDTLNFRIPWNYLQKTLEIQPVINYDHAVPESNYTNNSGSWYSLTFNPRNVLHLVVVRVHYTHNGQDGLSPVSAVFDTMDYIRKTYPVRLVSYWVPSTGDILDFDGDLTTNDGWEDLLDEVGWLNDHTDDPGYKWYGLIPDTVSGLRYNGMAWCPGSEAIGIAYKEDTMAHKVAHNFGRRRAPCGGPDHLDPDFPYPDGRIGKYGLDPDTQDVYDAISTKDVMTYCCPRWLSPYTYEALYDEIGAASSQMAVANSLTQEQSYLMISGRVDTQAIQAVSAMSTWKPALLALVMR